MSSRQPHAEALGRLAGRDDPPRRHPRSGGAPAALALPSVMGHPLAPRECPLRDVGSARRHATRSARDRGGAHLFAGLGLRAASMNRRTRTMLWAAAWLVCASLSQAVPKDDRAPQVPENLKVPAGNETTFHAHATRGQIYLCHPSATHQTQFAWRFNAPEAKLLDARRKGA